MPRLSPLAGVGASPSALASSSAMCQKQVHYAARVVPFVVVPARNLHEGGVQLDASLGNEVREMGSVSKSVKTSASSV